MSCEGGYWRTERIGNAEVSVRLTSAATSSVGSTSVPLPPALGGRGGHIRLDQHYSPRRRCRVQPRKRRPQRQNRAQIVIRRSEIITHGWEVGQWAEWASRYGVLPPP